MKKNKSALVFVVFSLFFHIFSTPIIWATDDSWITMEPMPETDGILDVAVAYGKIYVINSDFAFEFDPAENVWTNKTSMPTQRRVIAVTSYENKIYVVTEPDGLIQVYDPATDMWQNKTSVPTPRTDLEAVAVNGKIYFIGGLPTDHEPKNYTCSPVNEVYDVATDSWSTKKPVPYTAFAYASAVINDKIYLTCNTGLQIYDTTNDSWSLGAPPLLNLTYAAAGTTTGVMAPKRIYVFGGAASLDGENVTQVYDPENDTWTFGTPMLRLRFGHSVAVINDVLYVIGGKSCSLFCPPLTSVEKYTPTDYIPEFPSSIILPLVLTATLVVVVYRKCMKNS